MPAEQNGSHAVRAAAFRRTHAIEKDYPERGEYVGPP
jgi:hypothetical protein